MPTFKLQSVLFNTKYWNETSAKAWLTKHKLKKSKPVIEGNNIHFRQSAPNKTKQYITKPITPTISYILISK